MESIGVVLPLLAPMLGLLWGAIAKALRGNPRELHAEWPALCGLCEVRTLGVQAYFERSGVRQSSASLIDAIAPVTAMRATRAVPVSPHSCGDIMHLDNLRKLMTLQMCGAGRSMQESRPNLNEAPEVKKDKRLFSIENAFLHEY